MDHAMRIAVRDMRGGHHGDGVGQALGNVAGAIDGIEGDIESESVIDPGTKFVAKENARGVVLDPFTA